MRDDLPTGTVTFLFTDVEGSTRLLEELGAEQYGEALNRHRSLIRSSLAEYGGAEVDTQGDAFFCAFSSARAAVACAQDVQSRLAETPIRVRVGVHSGEALLVDDHYVGMDVHRGARIGACGHGGQVVLSPATVGLLEHGSFPLRELGEHRLKDLSAPVMLYQLGEVEFGPLNTLFRTNLPVPATPFLGRQVELRELVERASQPDVRLLTLTGPGGTGKTRVALQLAAELGDDYPDGVQWVALASLRDAGLVPSAVAQVLDVQEEPGYSLSSAIARSVRDKRLLLLVDNCEHLLDAVAEVVSSLVASCPHVLVLTTSRERLAVTGEHVYAVQPLLPTDAVTLFESRARAAGAALHPETRGAIEDLCARLDNLPLAVELAAARAAVLPPGALLERLSSRLDVLKGPRDAEERQRTLRAAIAWSHDLLASEEQRLFRRLSVFSAGAAPEVVETVCEADLEELLSLVAKSLVRQTATAGEEPRYWMLETIREFAATMLDAAGETATFRDRHLDWFSDHARDARGRMAGPGSAEVLARLEQDLGDLRAALGWALSRTSTYRAASGSRESALALGGVLATLHLLHGRYAEAEDVLRSMLALDPGPREAALAQSRLGRVLRHRGNLTAGLEAHLEAERLLEEVSERDDAWWEAWIDVKVREAHHYYFQGDVTALRALIAEVAPHVERRATPLQELDFLHVVAQDAYRRERYALSEETESLVREIHRRATALEEADFDFTLGFCLLWRGKLDEAESALRRGLESARRRGDALIEVRCIVYGALARRRQADVEGVRALLAELEGLDELHGYAGLASANLAWLAFRDGDHDAVVRLAQAAFENWEPGDRSGPTVFQWTARFPMLGVELARGRDEAAFEHAAGMLDPWQQPLPSGLQALVAEAIAQQERSLLEQALEFGRPSGYA